MATRVASGIAGGNSDEAAAALVAQLKSQLQSHKPCLVMLFASTKQPLDQLLPTVRAALQEGASPGPVVLGVSTAGEFTQSDESTGTASAFALAGDYRVFAGIGHGLRENVENAVMQATSSLPTEVAGYPHRTALLLLDGLAGAGEEATLLAAAVLGPEVQLVGCCASDDWQLTRTMVGCDQHIAADALCISMIFSKQPLGIGVCHGHTVASEPRIITRSEGNIVREIDGRPAWDVWQELTRPLAMRDGVELGNPDSRSDVLQFFARYEAGIRQGKDLRIRMPLLLLEHGAIGFACGMPEGTQIQLVDSTQKRQLASARAAAKQARTRLGECTVAGALVFDCACRKLLLGEQFVNAVHDISQELGNVPVAGFESYGEIALTDGEMSGFHNTTTVLLAFPEDTASPEETENQASS